MSNEINLKQAINILLVACLVVEQIREKSVQVGGPRIIVVQTVQHGRDDVGTRGERISMEWCVIR